MRKSPAERKKDRPDRLPGRADTQDERLRENMLKRGDTEEMITERLAVDDLEEQFQQHNLVADFTITDDTLNGNTVTNVLQWLLQRLLLLVTLRFIAMVA